MTVVGGIDRAAAFLARGERAAARASLLAVVQAAGADRGEALVRLATLDEEDGRPGDAVARWQEVLADDIDHDVAWANLNRLRARGADARVPGPAAPASPTLDSAVGINLSRFEITGELGRGAFGTVYRVRDIALDLPLALKVLHPLGGGDSEARARRRDEGYFAEMRRVAALRHPGIIAIYDIDDRARTLVMELIPGSTLRDRLRAPDDGDAGSAQSSSPLGTVPALARFARRLLAATTHVHAAGQVHGDLSPRNVLLRPPDDQPVLVDFGNAFLGAPDGADADAPGGTPLYLAPEQFHGAPPSAGADLFAVGALLFEATFGRPLRSRADLLAGRVTPGALPAVSGLGAEAALHARLRDVIAALVHASPEARGPAAASALARLL